MTKITPLGVELTKMRVSWRKTRKLPKQPAQCADLLYDTRQLRLQIQKQVDELQELETQLNEYFIDNLSKQDATGIAGQLARVQIIPKVIPVVDTEHDGWNKVYAFVKRFNRFDLLQKRLTESAVTEMWEAGKQIPGVTKFHCKKVSCTLVKGGK
jgi:hypothetical protein